MSTAKNEGVVVSARIKAAVSSFLHNSPVKKSFREVAAGIESVMDELQYSEEALRAMLSWMSDNELILTQKDGNKVFYSSLTNKESRQSQFQLHLVGKSDIRPTKPNEFLFDIVRSNGHLRITHQGAQEEFKIKGPLRFKIDDKEIVLNIVID